MVEGGNFNIQESTPINDDLIVTFSPALNTEKYTYSVFENNKLIETKEVLQKESSNIHLKETGVYQISVKTYDKDGKENIITSGNYVIDKEAPIIEVKDKTITIEKGEQLPSNNVVAKDNYDGDLTDQITHSEFDTNIAGTKALTYVVSDQAGNSTTQTINITVMDNPMYLYTVWGLVLIFLASIIYLITRFSRGISLSKRIEPYTIKPLKTTSLSLLDKVALWYQSKLEKLEKVFKNSTIASKYSKKLEKYTAISSIHKSGMSIFISKIFIAFGFLIIAVIAKAFQFKMLALYEMLLPLIIGFFLLDIVYFIRYKVYRSKLENDLLSAITIMNNAFKAGRSITQAIDIVSKELEGDIAKEFSKMSLELSYGLGIDTVFKRFSERVNLEEVNYLTASLTILNKTGGNIIEVFSSIEKSLFNKKTLRLELQSLTASSRIIVYALFAVPFLFIIFVSIISPGYFTPFISTHLGRILLIFLVIYYIIFIISVRKIMKVVI